jgi:hypothetical protein
MANQRGRTEHAGPKTYANDDLDTTWRRISRHDWVTKYSKADPRLRHLRTVRERRDRMIVVICDCEDQA